MPTETGQKKQILFCIPFSGGSAHSYAGWQRGLEEWIELIPIELAGRGKRMQEPFYENFLAAVQDVTSQIVQKIDDSDYALFGHSLGGLLAYEVNYKLIQSQIKRPNHLFISAANPPHVRAIEGVHLLSDEEMIRYLQELGGMPGELLEFPEYLKFILPIVRADLKLFDSYALDLHRKPVECGLTIFHGRQDPVIQEDIRNWNRYAGQGCEVHEFAAGHFFIQTDLPEVLNRINQKLA